MPGQIFAPLTLTGGYGTTVANGAEWPPNTAARWQSANINSGLTVSGEVTFDASASVGFGRITFCMNHLGNQSGGWTVSAQLKVAGVNVGSPFIVSRPGFNGIYKMGNHSFPLSSSASVAANPSAVSVAWTATNLHTSTQQHWIDAVCLAIAPAQPLPTVSGIDWDDVHDAWDLAVSSGNTADGSALYMIPSLKTGQHLILTNGACTYETDVAPTGICQFTTGWLGTHMELEAGLTDSWEVIVCRTMSPLPLGDSTSQVIISTHSNQVKGANAVGVPGYKLATAIASREDLSGPGWIRFVGSVESESNHIRSNDTPATNTRYVLLARNQSGGNEELYRNTGPDDMVAGDKIIDEDAADETNQRWGVGVGRREDGSRQWTGGFEGFWVLSGSLTQAEALEYANRIGQLHDLVEGEETGSGGGIATVTVVAVGGGKEGHASGGVASVPIAATGGGTPGTAFSGGGSSSVSVVATGGGTSSAFPSGGGTSPVVVVSNGGGVARELGRGGGTTVVATASTGGGTAWWPGSEPEVFAGPWVSKATVVDDRATIAAGS